jgi:hypothetical protein
MSGPKVVRIVTREEIEAICRGLIADVESAAAELLCIAARHLDVTDSIRADAERRVQALAHLLRSEQWLEVQKQAPQTLAYVRSEGDRLRNEAVAAAAAGRARHRRLIEGAQGIVAALRTQNLAVPERLRESLTHAARGQDNHLAELQSAMNEALRMLALSVDRSKASGSRDLARRLSAGETSIPLSEWLATRPPREVNRADARLDQILAELDILEDRSVAAALGNRASTLFLETSPERRALLTDSLVLDASAALRDQRTREQARRNMRETIARLDALDHPSLPPIRARLWDTLSAEDTAGSEGLVTEAVAALEAARADVAGAARRRAVLSGLAALGYEIREGLATALAHQGRVIVRKPGSHDYGLELAAPADGARIQVRLVGSTSPSAVRTPARDRDQEVIWCSEFTMLRDLVAKSGNELVIERALEAGAQAVKSVELAAPADVLVEHSRSLSARTLG